MWKNLLVSLVSIAFLTKFQAFINNRFEKSFQVPNGTKSTQKFSKQIVIKDPIEFSERLKIDLEQSKRQNELFQKKEKEREEEERRNTIFKMYLEYRASCTSILKDLYNRH